MKRFVLTGAAALAACGCQLPAERTATLPPPLPEKVSSLPYAELLTRARTQASIANEAFYKDSWGELEDAAKGLEQTARYLTRAEDVPAKHKDTLAVMSGDLNKAASLLREAAATKDVKKSTESLQKVQLMVREMRLSN